VSGPARVDGQPGPVAVPVTLGALARRVALPRPAGQADGDRAGRAGARGGDHLVGGRHREHVSGLPSFQVSAQAWVAAADLIAGDPGGRGPRIQRTGDHGPGQLRLGREHRRVRDACCGAPGRTAGPGPGQVQLPAGQRVTGRRGVRHEHRHLAVLHPPRRARILALHARTGRSLFKISSLVDHQDRIRAAQVLHDVATHVIADRVGVPPGRR
jgi:hypothetical protein